MTNSPNNQRNGENQRMAVNNGEIEMLVEELEHEREKVKELVEYLQVVHEAGLIDASRVLDKYK